MYLEWLERLVPWMTLVGTNSLKAIPLILFLVALQKWARRWITPRGMRALWFLAVARLFIPEIVFTPASVYGLPAMMPVKFVQQIETVERETTAPIFTATNKAAELRQTASIASTSVQSSRPSEWKWEEAITLLWLLGMMGMAAMLIAQSWRFYRRFAHLRPSTDPTLLELLEDCKEQAGVRTPVSLTVSESVTAPVLYGCLRPRLLLPAALTRSLTREQLRCIFQHEIAHVHGWDIGFNWLASATMAVHWFNPFVWLMTRKMAQAREMACDQAVLTHRNDPQVYGDVILSVAENLAAPQVVAGAAGIVENKSAMKERIEMLTQTHGKRGWIVALGTALILGALFLSGPGSLWAESSSNKSGNVAAPAPVNTLPGTYRSLQDMSGGQSQLIVVGTLEDLGENTPLSPQSEGRLLYPHAKIKIKRTLKGTESGELTVIIDIDPHDMANGGKTAPEKGKDYLFFISLTLPPPGMKVPQFDPQYFWRIAQKIVTADELTLNAMVFATRGEHPENLPGQIDSADTWAAARAAALPDAIKIGNAWLSNLDKADKYKNTPPPLEMVLGRGDIWRAEQAWVSYLVESRAPLGRLQNRQPPIAEFKLTEGGEHVTLKYLSSFDLDGVLTQVHEVVEAWRDPDGKWQITNYTVEPVASPATSSTSPAGNPAPAGNQ